MTNDVPDIADESGVDELRSLLDEATESLEPIAPQRVVELYLDDRRRDCSEATGDAHRSRLGFFVEWCEQQGVENMNDLTARDLHEFRVWRREDLNVVSERTQLSTLRVFIQWCETFDAVSSGLFTKIVVPTVPSGKGSRETVIHADRTEEILEHLATYDYATVERVCWLVLAETGIRMGAARALDVDDYRPDADTPHLDIVHRPESDTPIKNGVEGERPVGISPEVCEVIDDYLRHQRPDVTDDYGREPLLATTYGRPASPKEIKYIASIEEIVPAEEATLARDADTYTGDEAGFDPGDQVVVFEPGSLYELEDPIQYKEKAPQGRVYTELGALRSASTTEDVI